MAGCCVVPRSVSERYFLPKHGLLHSDLEKLSKELRHGHEATAEEIARIFEIVNGPMHIENVQSPRLGSFIKGELGSYITAAVSFTHQHPYPEEVRDLLDKPEKLLAVAARIRYQSQP